MQGGSRPLRSRTPPHHNSGIIPICFGKGLIERAGRLKVMQHAQQEFGWLGAVLMKLRPLRSYTPSETQLAVGMSHRGALLDALQADHCKLGGVQGAAP